jgi:hypothetical protein
MILIDNSDGAIEISPANLGEMARTVNVSTFSVASSANIRSVTHIVPKEDGVNISVSFKGS